MPLLILVIFLVLLAFDTDLFGVVGLLFFLGLAALIVILAGIFGG